MQKLKRMPKTGQFVAIWKNNGDIFSYTYKWVEKDLFVPSYSMNNWDEEQDTHFPEGVVFFKSK